MPTELPKGWVKTPLGEVCAKVATTRPEDSPDTEFTYFDIGGIDNQSNRIVETKTFVGREAPSRARQSVRKDDILFSTVRTYLKKIARIEHDYPNPIASTGFTVIRAAEGVSPQFLFSQVLSEVFCNQSTRCKRAQAIRLFATRMYLPKRSGSLPVVSRRGLWRSSIRCCPEWLPAKRPRAARCIDFSVTARPFSKLQSPVNSPATGAKITSFTKPAHNFSSACSKFDVRDSNFVG
jgi:hypothetical protein